MHPSAIFPQSWALRATLLGAKTENHILDSDNLRVKIFELNQPKFNTPVANPMPLN